MEQSIMSPIKSLTPEQEALILVYRDKWREIVLSTEPIDRQRAEGTLRAAYALAGKADPEFRFLNGPGELQELWQEQSFLNFFFGQLGELVPLYDTQFLKQLQNRFTPDLWKQIVIQPESELFELQYQLYFLATHPLSRQFRSRSRRTPAATSRRIFNTICRSCATPYRSNSGRTERKNLATSHKPIFHAADRKRVGK
jgi:hypothetical protein